MRFNHFKIRYKVAYQLHLSNPTKSVQYTTFFLYLSRITAKYSLDSLVGIKAISIPMY